MKKYNISILVVTSILIFISCVSQFPKIEQGAFLVNSSIGNKVIAGETIEINYHLRKGEKVDYFLTIIGDYYDNYTEKYFKPIIKDSICSFKIMIPHNANSLYVLAGGNIGCFTGGYSRKDFIVYNNDGTLKKENNRLLVDILLQKEDITAADSTIKATLKEYPDNFMVLDNYWKWLSQNGKTAQLLEEINKLKKDTPKKEDEYLAIICAGYNYLGQIDSMTCYLEKYITSSSFPGFASRFISTLNYLCYSNNQSFEKETSFQKTVALKCPLSTSADNYLEQVLSLGKRDSLAEKIIALKTEQSREDFYFKAFYDLQILKDTLSAKEAALKYLNYAKNVFIPDIQLSENKDIIRIPKIYELLADISKDSNEAYSYIKEAINKNKNSILASPLQAKAACYAFKCKNVKVTKNHIIQICKLGKLSLAKATILKLYPNEQADKLLSSFYKESATLCEYAPDLTFTINSITSYSTNDKKIIFLNLWNPGCVPCIKEIPLLNKLKNTFNSNDIIWLSQDFGKESMNNLPTKFTGWSLYQKSKEINNAFYKESINPQTYIIDRHKKIRCHTTGYDENSLADYKLILELLTNEK
jgi:thiol-disulfide isomerase/thioredoxin